MSERSPADFDQVNSRVVELESRFMHLERTMEELNQVLLLQQRQVESLKRAMEKLDGQLDTMAGADTARTPEEERPPHY
jgi:uncharacterized coiled-coil protein SlyX